MKKLFKIILFFILLTVITLVAAIPAINVALKNERVRNSLLQKIAASLNGELQADALSIALDENSVNISSRDLKGKLLNNALIVNIPDAGIKFTYADLLQGSFFPDTFQATSPQINYIPRHAPAASTPAQINWSVEINTQLKKILGRGAQIDISGGTLTLASTTLSKLFIRTNPGNKPSTALNMRTDILHNGSVMPLDIKGTYKNQLAGAFTYEFDVNTASVPLNLIPSSPDFFFSKGTGGFTGKLAGNGREINLDGSIRFNNLDMTVGWTSDDYLSHQEKPYRIARCTLVIQGGLQGQKIDFPTLDLQSEDFHLQGSLLLDFANITNPFMDLRLRSGEMAVATLKMLLPDPLINEWTTRTIFPRLKNGTARMTNFILAGTTGEIGRLGEPENAHCLSWSGILHDVDTFYNDHKPLARIHSANLSMDGDLLKLREVSGESGNSTLTSGNLSINKLYEPTPILTTDVKGSFSLAWLTKLAKAGIVGEEMKKMVSPVSTITGQVNGYVNLSLALADKLKLQTLNGKGSAAPMELALKNITFPLKMKRADFTLAYPGTCVINGKGSWGKSTFDGSLNLVEFDKKQQFKMNIRPDLTELKKTFTDNQTIHSLAPCIATLPVKTDITMEDTTITTSGSLDFTQSVPLDDSETCRQRLVENQLLKTDFRINYSGKNLNVKKMSLYTKDGDMQITGFLKNDRKPPFFIKKMSLKAINFPLQALNVLMPNQDKRLTGILTAYLDAADLSLENIWQTVNGSLELKGWQGSLAIPEVTVNNMDLTATMNNSQIEFRGSNILLADFNTELPLTLLGDLQKKDVWNGTVRVYGDYLDLTTSPSLFRERKTDLVSTLPIGVIRIIAGVDRVRYRNLIFSPLLIQSYITADRIIISKSLLQLDEDFIWLTGYQQDDDVIYKSYFKIREKPVDTLMAMMGFDNDIISGDLNMEGKLTARVTPGEIIFETTTGPIYFEIKDGILESSSTLIKILDLISLENILDKQDILNWKNSFNYNQIGGRFDLAEGVFTTNSLIMNAPAFDLFAEGSLDVLHDNVNMQVKLAPFGTINKLFSSIPFLGYVLTGKTKSLFDYTLSVVGKIGSPDVQYTPLVDTIDSLTGYVKRLVTGREEIKQEINAQQKVDIDHKKSFILRMDKELVPLHQIKKTIIPSG